MSPISFVRGQQVVSLHSYSIAIRAADFLGGCAAAHSLRCVSSASTTRNPCVADNTITLLGRLPRCRIEDCAHSDSVRRTVVRTGQVNDLNIVSEIGLTSIRPGVLSFRCEHGIRSTAIRMS
ncbi:hypothetical protein SCHPADRAFT_238123 [Schizopora paradoxa]|uniref:Uncharacterized protein n=1 Tax=Schizopora paradoxa TaxID=27342 RepID=A0A0H2SG07_9AGAM|nr:hypothetical protein SCHPADRAFT_238123 [Schizopora paradoxa]